MSDADGVIAGQWEASLAPESNAVVDQVAKPGSQPPAAFIGQVARQGIPQGPAIRKSEVHKQVDVAEGVTLIVPEVNEKIILRQRVGHLPFKGRFLVGFPAKVRIKRLGFGVKRIRPASQSQHNQRRET
jgi:hypothetical protein